MPPVERHLLFQPGPARQAQRLAAATVQLSVETVLGRRAVQLLAIVVDVAVEAALELGDRRQRQVVFEVGRQPAIALPAVGIVEVAERLIEVVDVRRGARVRGGAHVELGVAERHARVAGGDARPVRLIGGAAPDAGVGAGRVELLRLHGDAVVADVLRPERERRPRLAVVVERHGDRRRQAAERQLAPEAERQARRDRQLRLGGDLNAVPLAGALGDDVDDAEHGVRAVEHRARTEDDLDVVDEIERDRGAALEVRGAVELLVHGVAVDQQQDVVAEVGGQQHAARADVDRVQRVLREHAERQVVDRLVERTDAEAAQVVGGDRRRGRGRGARRLQRLRGGREDRLLDQAAQLGEVFLGQERRATARRGGGGRRAWRHGAAASAGAPPSIATRRAPARWPAATPRTAARDRAKAAPITRRSSSAETAWAGTARSSAFICVRLSSISARPDTRSKPSTTPRWTKPATAPAVRTARATQRLRDVGDRVAQPRRQIDDRDPTLAARRGQRRGVVKRLDQLVVRRGARSSSCRRARRPAGARRAPSWRRRPWSAPGSAPSRRPPGSCCSGTRRPRPAAAPARARAR